MCLAQRLERKWTKILAQTNAKEIKGEYAHTYGNESDNRYPNEEVTEQTSKTVTN